MSDDRRIEDRSHALKTGEVFFGEQQECRDCLVWDLSKTGAMIEADLGEAHPERFRLISKGLYLNQLCAVVWREGRKFGVKFIA